MAKLKPSYDSSTDIPQGYEGAFEEKEGKFVFSGGEFEFKTEAEFNELHSKKKSAFDELHTVKSKLKAFEGIDVEDHKSMVEELDVLRAKSKEGNDEETIKAIVDSRVARETKDLKERLTASEAENKELKDFKLSSQKSKAINKVLKQHVSKEAFEDAKFIINSAITKEADGSYVSNGQAGFEKGLSIEKLVEKAAETRPHWKKKSVEGHGGDGSNGAGSKNKRQELNALLSKDKLTRQETKRMDVLAAEIKAEEKGA